MQRTANSTLNPNERTAITTDDLRELLSCGRATATKIGNAANARIQIDKRVLWNVGKIKRYIDDISGTADE